MVVIASGLPVCVQIASFFFFGAALFGDLLLIRLWLSAAFVFLLLESCVVFYRTDVVLLDAFGWALVTGSFHFVAAYRLLREAYGNRRDEKRDETLGVDDAALERFLRRRTGASRKDMVRLRRCGEWVSYGPGDGICDTDGSREFFHVIVEGLVRIEWRNENSRHPNGTMIASGDAFDLRVLNLAGVFVGFPNDSFAATATTNARLFRIPVSSLVSLVESHGQFHAFLRVLALDQLARAYAKASAPAALPTDSYGQREHATWRDGARSRDFVAPYDDLEQHELRPPSLATWLASSFSPTVQPGSRNTFFPVSGRLAKAHVESCTTSGLLTAKQEASSRLLQAADAPGPGPGRGGLPKKRALSQPEPGDDAL